MIEGDDHDHDHDDDDGGGSGEDWLMMIDCWW